MPCGQKTWNNEKKRESEERMTYDQETWTCEKNDQKKWTYEKNRESEEHMTNDEKHGAYGKKRENSESTDFNKEKGQLGFADYEKEERRAKE